MFGERGYKSEEGTEGGGEGTEGRGGPVLREEGGGVRAT